MTTRITVNGEDIALDGPASVQDIVDQTLTDGHGMSSGRGIAVAVNSDVVPRGAWGTTAVNAGDRIEILTATQGG